MKRTGYFLLLLILAGCSQSNGGDHSPGIVSQMLRSQAAVIAQDTTLTFHKIVNYAGRSETTAVEKNEIIKMDSALLELDPDKLIHNSGFTQLTQVNNGITELKRTRKPDESSPFKLMDCYYYQNGNQLTWRAMYLQHEDKNMLFHSIRSYILEFNKGLLTDITLHTFSKTSFGKVEDFRVDYMIRKK